VSFTAFYLYESFFTLFGLVFLLNKKTTSPKWFIEIGKDFFSNILLAFILYILLTALLLLTNNDFSLIETIYCDGETRIYLKVISLLNYNPGYNNIPSNSPDTNSKTKYRKIELDSEKYYHVRKDSADKAVELLGKGYNWELIR
jgi:hypothetical protein